MPLPDFLLIGAQKAGTTSLVHYLGQHPRVGWASVKEPGFLARGDEGSEGPPGEKPGPTTLAAYAALFRDAGRLRSDEAPCAIGEATTAYLYAARAPERARNLLGEPRLVVVLRQPAERAFSNWMHARREGREEAPTFAEALAVEEARIQAGWGFQWHYAAKSRYAPQLQRWLALFPRERLLVLLTDDLERDPTAACQQVFQHLGVDPAFTPDTSERLHVSGTPPGVMARTRIQRAIIALGARVPAGYRRQVRDALFPRVELDGQTRRAVTAELFAEDIARTSELIDRDLSAWLA